MYRGYQASAHGHVCVCLPVGMWVGGLQDTNEARDLIMKRSFRKSVENTKVSMEPDALNDLEFVARDAVKELLSSLGEVTESGPCAFNSVASGAGILAYQMQSQRGMKFTVMTKSRQGQSVARGGEKVLVRIDEKLEPEWEVEDGGDGSYRVEYRLKVRATLVHDGRGAGWPRSRGAVVLLGVCLTDGPGHFRLGVLVWLTPRGVCVWLV